MLCIIYCPVLATYRQYDSLMGPQKFTPPVSTGTDWPSDKQEAYAATMRDLWKQENDLMSARFGWFTTLQGLLFAALGFAWQHELRAIVNTLCGLGLAVVLSTMVVFWFGMKAWGTLGALWDTKLATYTGPPITGYKNTRKLWWQNIVPTPWWVLPMAFLAAWIYIVWYLNHYGLTSVDNPIKQQTELKQSLATPSRQQEGVKQGLRKSMHSPRAADSAK
jgi:hypothetical protein